MRRPLPWVKLDRDFYSDPQFLEAYEQFKKAEVLASYAVLLAVAARADGTYGDRVALARTLRSAVGLRAKTAEGLVVAFVTAGILREESGLMRLCVWDSLRPAERYLSREQRRAGATTESVAITTESVAGTTQIVETRQEERREEERREEATAPSSMSQQAFLETLQSGEQVARLLPAPRPTVLACSHGHRWKEQPAGSKEGKSWPAYLSGDHKLPSGSWCKDRPPVPMRSLFSGQLTG
jgi:hypothetical protein